MIYDEVGYFRFGATRVKLNDKYGFIDETGHEIIPIIYDNLDYDISGAICVKLNGKYGLINKVGMEIAPIIYDEIAHSIGPVTKVRLNDKCGIIEKATGRIIIPVFYDDIIFDDINLPFEGFYRLQLNGKWGFFNKNGQEIISLVYDKVENFREGRAWVILNGKGMFIDEPTQEK